ncbi:MAG: hypothetical protein ABIK09_18670 [Pseudomonadota bacterium]
MARRLLLLEILPDDRYRNYRSQHYPFAAGLERRLGGAVRWLCAGVEAIPVASGRNPFVYGLSATDRAALVGILRDWAPTHVMVNERLEDELWEALRAAAAGASFSMADILHRRRALWDYTAWLHLDGDDLDPTRLIEEQVTPWFGKEPLNGRAVEIRPFTHVTAGPECVYVRPLAQNPWYADVDLAACSRDVGCAFCDCPDVEIDLPDGDAVALAVDQVLAAEAGLPEAFRTREYLMRGSNLLPRLGKFFGALLVAGLPPSVFRFGCRLDEFVRLEATLRDLLPRLDAAGHCLHLWNMGIENFSPVENERFHKGLTVETIDRGIALLRELRGAFPRAFRPPEGDGFGFILFTPWTTLDDLRLNVREFRRHGLQVPSAFVGSALQLLPGRPITALAAAHGLTATGSEDFLDSGCITSWDEAEVPWRFKDPVVARVYRTGRRLIPGTAIPGQDPEYLEIHPWWRGIEERGASLIDVFEALIEVVAGSPEAPVAVILRGVEGRLRLDQGAGPDWAGIATALAHRLEGWEAAPRPGGRPGLTLAGPGLHGPLALVAEARTPESRAFLTGARSILYYPGDARTPTSDETPLLEEILGILDALF